MDKGSTYKDELDRNFLRALEKCKPDEFFITAYQYLWKELKRRKLITKQQYLDTLAMVRDEPNDKKKVELLDVAVGTTLHFAVKKI